MVDGTTSAHRAMVCAFSTVELPHSWAAVVADRGVFRRGCPTCSNDALETVTAAQIEVELIYNLGNMRAGGGGFPVWSAVVQREIRSDDSGCRPRRFAFCRITRRQNIVDRRWRGIRRISRSRRTTRR